MRLPLAALLAFASASALAQTSTDTLTCTLERAGTEYKGICEIPCQVNALAVNFDGITRGFSCETAPRRVSASLRKVPDKTAYWLGTMEGVQPEDPTRFELLEAARIAKLPYGWFAVSGTEASDSKITLTIAADKQLSPTTNDIKILERARQLIPDRARWNKADTRECPPNQARLSLFCALMQATQEVSGGVHYRQPALQAAREVLNEVGVGRMGKHRLMDYNNHPDTTLEEIHNLLRTAQARVEKWGVR